MSNLPYPFSKAHQQPYYQVALGTGEYVWVVLAGDYRAAVDELERYKDLYAAELNRGK
jgi:hypothetical protein